MLFVLTQGVSLQLSFRNRLIILRTHHSYGGEGYNASKVNVRVTVIPF